MLSHFLRVLDLSEQWNLHKQKWNHINKVLKHPKTLKYAQFWTHPENSEGLYFLHYSANVSALQYKLEKYLKSVLAIQCSTSYSEKHQENTSLLRWKRSYTALKTACLTEKLKPYFRNSYYPAGTQSWWNMESILIHRFTSNGSMLFQHYVPFNCSHF